MRANDEKMRGNVSKDEGHWMTRLKAAGESGGERMVSKHCASASRMLTSPPRPSLGGSGVKKQDLLLEGGRGNGAPGKSGFP